jgi:hypothetical protein
MGGASGVPDNPALGKDLEGLGGSRGQLQPDVQVPSWAQSGNLKSFFETGDMSGIQSWLMANNPNSNAVPEAGAAKGPELPGANAAPEPATMASIAAPSGVAQPTYSAGTGVASQPTTPQGGRLGGILAGPVTPAAPAAPAGMMTREQVQAEQQRATEAEQARQSEWVFAQLPESMPNQVTEANLRDSNFNVGGLYMPTLQDPWNPGRLNNFVAGATQPPSNYTLPSDLATRQAGSTLDAATASQYPRMRRALYDFNMRAYGNPYGPAPVTPPPQTLAEQAAARTNLNYGNN